MRALLVLLLTGVLASGLRAQADPARFFPLDVGNRWVWIGGDDDSPSFYYRLEVVGDTLIGGEPYALGEAAKLTQLYEPVATAHCAVRITPHGGGHGSEVEAIRVSGDAPCLPPAVGNQYEPDIGEMGEPMTVEIGGISYDLEEVTEIEQWLPGIGSGWERFGAGVGPLLAFFNYNPSHGGGGYSSELVYARVGGETYGANPVASEPAAEAPGAFRVRSAFPNPFRGAATVAFALPAPEPVALAVFDVRGRLVQSADLGTLRAGAHRATLDGAGLAPGLYLVRLATASGQQATHRLLHVE